ncbi:TrbI/VirB10 family protein [Pseudomonas sp. JG-B]|uniref:TrbI/VirB10 family protein n=1 Tax=Pseudomonas sp. JG-B TaxID=2603214 RepID=UPI00129E9AF4|nr:TrbI/VirB10 family protein [Pseudomonas sp. JG-B]MRK19076.1 TrbI/VirB10 family protein [Pseudomonas sp. JG-B]
MVPLSARPKASDKTARRALLNRFNRCHTRRLTPLVVAGIVHSAPRKTLWPGGWHRQLLKALKLRCCRIANFLVAEGTTLDCVLETAIDTTLPGKTRCVLMSDIYSDNKNVVLAEKGSVLTGEQQGGIQQGQARVFVLWNRLKTTKGVVISLNSPGTDQLGRSGLSGWVDTHFAERFQAAILMSIVQASVQIAVEKSKDQSGSTVISDSTNEGQGIVEKPLKTASTSRQHY